MPETPETQEQWALLRRWLPTLEAIPAIDVIWLEGSLAVGRGNPCSDIDIRFGIDDAQYTDVWEQNRAQFLQGLGETLTFETSFVRVVTTDGILVEAAAYPTSALDGKELYEWEILFSRLVDGRPHFTPAPDLPPAQVWPDPEPLTPDWVWQRSKFLLLMMIHTPAAFFAGETDSIRLTLDMAREDLRKLMWRRTGLRFGKRAKHMSEIFPQKWLQELQETYAVEPGTASGLVQPLLRVYELQARHLGALAEKAGSGFPHEWHQRLYAVMANRLSAWSKQKTTDVEGNDRYGADTDGG